MKTAWQAALRLSFASFLLLQPPLLPAKPKQLPSRPSVKVQKPVRQLKTKPCWEAELDKALTGLELTPVKRLRKDSRCDVRLIEEKLFHKVSQSTLKNDPLKSSAALIRLSRGLKCIGPSRLRELDRRLADYIKKLAAKKETSCREGLAGVANAAILVIDFFPNVRESRLQQEIQAAAPQMIDQLQLKSNSEVGLWCDDHFGSVNQYQRTCSGTGSSGRGSRVCIDPTIQMVSTYADQNSALGLGRCRCTQMVENNFLCDQDLPPCLQEMMAAGQETPSHVGGSQTPTGPIPSSGKSSASSGGGLKTSSGGGGGLNSAADGGSGFDRFGPMGGVAQFGNGSVADQMTSFLGQYSEYDLRTMGCNQQRMRDFMAGISGIAASTRCDARALVGMATAVTTALGGSNGQQIFENEMRCYMDAARRDRERQFEFREGSQAFMDLSCGVTDGDNGDPAQPPPTPQQPTRPATEEEKRRSEEAARQAAARLRNQQTTDGHNLAVLAQQTSSNPQQAQRQLNAAISAAQRAGANARVSDDLSDNTPQAQVGGTITNPTVNVDADHVGDSRVMAHEMMHVAAEILTRGTITNEQVHQIMSNYLRDAGRHMPCPDCPDNCSVQDELVNDMMECFEGAEQAREQEILENSCRNPNNPIQCESYPDPNAPPPVDPALEMAFEACLNSGQPEDKTDYNGPAGWTDECMFGDQDCPLYQTTGTMGPDYNGPAGWTDPDPNEPDEVCPPGEEPVFGPQGIRCEPPRGIGGAAPGPGPDPEGEAPIYQYYQTIDIQGNDEGNSSPAVQNLLNQEDDEEDDQDSGGGFQWEAF